MLALQGDIEAAGGHVAVQSEVVRARFDGDSVQLEVSADGESTALQARVLVNAAGLHAVRVAQAITGSPSGTIPRLHYAKGNYFMYQGRSPFNHLVYPLPEEGGLGIHATMDLAGRTRFGPDVEWANDIDYSLDEGRAEAFYAAVRRYWPKLPDGALTPGYVGVRPKLTGPGESPSDFVIETLNTPEASGRNVQLFGIESPGLTASLAIGE
jgi:L-2-hydroxyglutarate oxidase LhgO